MSRKMISVFTAAVMSMTSIASVAVVSEAQAFGLKSIKKGLKSVKKGVKKTAKGVKTFAKIEKEGFKIFGKQSGRFGKAWVGIGVDMAGKAIGKGVGAAKTVKKSTKGAGQIALGTVKSAGRTIDRRLSQGCRALGSCRGTITRGVARKSKGTARRFRNVTRRSNGAARRFRNATRRSNGSARRFRNATRRSNGSARRFRNVARR